MVEITFPGLNAKNVFESLRCQFCIAEAEHGGSLFALELMTSREINERRQSNPAELILDHKSRLFCGFDYPTREPCFIQPVVAGPDRDAYGTERTQIFFDKAYRAWQDFEPLATNAGTQLPMTFRNALPEDPAQGWHIWCCFLFWAVLRNQEDLTACPNRRRLLSSSPFIDSADLIELCGLATDTPTVPEALATNSGSVGSDLLAPNDVDALHRLLRVFAEGVADERFKQAATLLQSNQLKVDAKLTQIDALIRFPPTASAQKLGNLIGCSKQAVMSTNWWITNRKGERDAEITRRGERHHERSEQHKKPTNDEDL